MENKDRRKWRWGDEKGNREGRKGEKGEGSLGVKSSCQSQSGGGE